MNTDRFPRNTIQGSSYISRGVLCRAAELLLPSPNTLVLCIHSTLKLDIQKPQTELAVQYNFSIPLELEHRDRRSLPQASLKLPPRKDKGML